MIMIMIIMKIIVIIIIVTIARRPFALSHEFLPTIFSIIIIIIYIIIVIVIIVTNTNTTREGVTSLMADNSASFCAGLSSLNLKRSMISRVTAPPMRVLSCSVHVNTNNHNNNPPQLTTTTFVTLLLPFSPSAIARPPTSVKPSLPSCITRRHTRRQPPTPSHIHIRTSHMRAKRQPLPPPPSQAPAYQVNLLQALESAQVHAQRLNVVVLQLLQRVV